MAPGNQDRNADLVDLMKSQFDSVQRQLNDLKSEINNSDRDDKLLKKLRTEKPITFRLKSHEIQYNYVE